MSRLDGVGAAGREATGDAGPPIQQVDVAGLPRDRLIRRPSSYRKQMRLIRQNYPLASDGLVT